jgi:hypothetical protein
VSDGTPTVEVADVIPYEVDIALIPPKNCDYGKQFENVTVSIDNARNDFAIKFENCTRPGACVCCVGLVALRDETGRLARQDI